MDVATTRFAPRTEEQLLQSLTRCRAEAQHCRDALAAEVRDGLHGRDVSDLLNEEGPTIDVDATTVLALIDAADERVWNLDQALVRLERGVYGICESCTVRITLERLRATPTTRWCARCSRAAALRMARGSDG